MNCVNEMIRVNALAPVPLAVYGNPLTVFLASIRSSWEANRGDMPTDIPGKDMCRDIPPRYFFEQLQEKLLPPVIDDGSPSAIEANSIITYLNNVDNHSILTVKQGLNRLQQLVNPKDYHPLFPENRFHPSLLDFTDDEENT